MSDQAERICAGLARKLAKDNVQEYTLPHIEQVLREAGLEDLLRAGQEWAREEFSPVKDVLLLNQRRKELRAALARCEEKVKE